DVAIIRNRFITAAYARMYLKNPASYPWLGIAAMASNDVGIGMSTMRGVVSTEIAGMRYDEVFRLLNDLMRSRVYDAAVLLGKGNAAVYNDIFWQFLAFHSGGIEQMKWLHAQDPEGFSKEQLNVWIQIDKGEPGSIDQGNFQLFYHEQHDILQPLVFDNIKP